MDGLNSSKSLNFYNNPVNNRLFNLYHAIFFMIRPKLEPVLLMPRSKYILVAAILGVILAVIAIGNIDPKHTVESMEVASNDSEDKSLVDLKQGKLYEWQKKELKAAIKAYFEKAIASGTIVGAGLSIVKGDSILISDGFGKRNAHTNDRVDGNTIFRLGSLSKGFAGILAADLIDEGYIDSDDKVIDCIPEFQLGDKANTDNITLASILSHSSGAPYHSYTDLVEAGLPLTDIAWRFKYVKPVSGPGQIYSYQNALFALSGEMIYQCTGQEITTSLEDRFFNPLGMCSTTMDYESLVSADNVALPHTKRRYGWRLNRLNDHYYNAIAAGGISANSIDMAKWMRFILGHNPEIMGKSAIAEAFKPVIKIPGRSKYYQRWPGHISSHYGYGWRIHKFQEGDSKEQKTIWHHGGSVNNYRNEIALYPEADLGICVLLNSNSRLSKTVVPDLYRIVQRVYKKTNGDRDFSVPSNDIERLTTSIQFY